MTHPTDHTNAYREGLRVLLDEHDARRRRVAERASALDAEARAELLPAQARELAAAEAQLARAPTTREDLEAANGVLDAYEKEVDVALSVLAELRESRAALVQARSRRRRPALVAAAGLGVVVIGLVAWGRYADHQAVVRHQEAYFAGCQRRPECAARGLCSAPPREAWGITPDCVAASDADCAASTECAEHGKCHAENGVCRALSREDCASSEGCRSRGECSPDQGGCRLLTSADCARSDACFLNGKCGFDQGACSALTAAGCASSLACQDRGECSADQGACRALTPDDCKHSKPCIERGACAPRDGKCVVTDESCRAMGDCKGSGRCSAVGSVCAPKDAADCARSIGCTEWGQCAFFANGCEVTAESCRASSICREDGDCTMVGNHCAARSADDCRKSLRCKKDGWCVLGETEHGDMYCVDSKGQRPGGGG